MHICVYVGVGLIVCCVCVHTSMCVNAYRIDEKLLLCSVLKYRNTSAIMICAPISHGHRNNNGFICARATGARLKPPPNVHPIHSNHAVPPLSYI